MIESGFSTPTRPTRDAMPGPEGLCPFKVGLGAAEGWPHDRLAFAWMGE